MGRELTRGSVLRDRSGYVLLHTLRGRKLLPCVLRHVRVVVIRSHGNVVARRVRRKTLYGDNNRFIMYSGARALKIGLATTCTREAVSACYTFRTPELFSKSEFSLRTCTCD